MASSDLGGLGAKDGPALAYNWTMASLMPEILPWMLLLLLLALKPNRAASAWLIWLPLGGLFALKFLLEAAGIINSGFLDSFSQIIDSLAFGLAAVWLVSPYLVRKLRVLTFLGLVLSFGFISILFYGIRQIWGNDWSVNDAGLIISLLVIGVCLNLAMFLAGLVCRRRYRPVWFSVWLVIWIILGFSACASPFVLFAALGNGFPLPWPEMVMQIVMGVSIATAGIFLVLLPFLILSFSNGFFRERFKALFHLAEPTVPPMAPPPILAPAGTEGI